MRREDALWGPIAIAADVVRSITKYPRELGLGLAVLLTLWGLPLIFLSNYVDERPADIRISVVSVAHYLVLVAIRAAWSAVPQGGAIRMALTATDGARPDVRDLVRGVSLFGSMYVPQLALTLGSIFAHFMPVDPTDSLSTSIVLILCLFLVFYLALRASLWQTIVVDKRCSVVAAFMQSWRYTRGRVWRLLLFWALPALTSVALIFATAMMSGSFLAAMAWQATLGFKLAASSLVTLFFGPYFILGIARIYRFEEGTPERPPETEVDPKFEPDHHDAALQFEGHAASCTWSQSRRTTNTARCRGQ